MCGIAGFIGPAAGKYQDHLKTALVSMAHRGPDADGVWVDAEAGVALGHVRLSIIDLDSAADQPFIDHTGQYVMTYNGEIYNYQQLRVELEAVGVRFRTSSDTEILLEAYKNWGDSCLNRLVGMFSFAIWDARRNRLFAARDRIGKKPFFYAQAEGGIAFASEVQALLKFSVVKTNYHKGAMQAFLMLGYSTGEQTLYAGVKRLLPGHQMVIQGGQVEISQYWDLIASFENKRSIGEGEAIEELNGLIYDATALRMQADVPYGLFLSGGIDSNAVLAAMVDQTEGDQVRSFTIGFEDPVYNEASIAARMAAHFGARHTAFTLRPDALDFDMILGAAASDPLADASIIPTYEVARQARAHVKMVLTGDGGDELFAGYPTYVADAMHRKFSGFMPFGLPLPEPKKRRTTYFKLYQFLKGLPLDGRRAHFSWRIYERDKNWRGLMQSDFAEGFSFEDVYQLFDGHYEKAKHLSPLDQALYVDTKTWLVDSVLVKADRASMAHGLEARSPLLDHRIVEFAAGLLDAMKLKWNGRSYETKSLLRRSQKDRLPGFIFDEPKRGFSVPLSDWVSGRMAEQVRAGFESSALQEFFDKKALDKLFENHKKGARDSGLTVFNIVMLARFLERKF